jgi:hypothetical protein
VRDRFSFYIIVAWEPLSAFSASLELVPDIPGAWELVGNAPNWLRTVLGTWEFFGSFNIKEMGAWKLVSKIESFKLKLY